MTRTLLLLLPLWAAGCTSVFGTGDPAEDRCRAEAYADPAVQDALLRSNSDSQQVRAPALMEMNALVRARVGQCLSGTGPAPRGGVEPVAPN